MKKILVTGGAGYIGSYIVRELKEAGFEPIIIDNFSSGHKGAVKGFKLYKIDLVSEKEKLNRLFRREKFSGVIHMASYIQMGESFQNPLKYFRNNLMCTINLLEAMQENSVKRIVFSSSAGVYGTPKSLPIKEDALKNPENPYGETKLMIERMLAWCDKAWGLKYTNIRYFNAAGAALDGSIGEDHPKESHLIPLAVKAAMKGCEFKIFGKDYNTPDGTCVRDYIHVLDLAKAHTLALKYLIHGGKSNYFNAGVGKGYSNRQVIEMIKKVTGLNFKVKYTARRPGDADVLCASNKKIKKELGWKPEYGLKEIIETAYLWHKKHPKGYKD